MKQYVKPDNTSHYSKYPGNTHNKNCPMCVLILTQNTIIIENWHYIDGYY